ncbi:uncharacterized protein B0I36DRAFT_382107 [Microdochium trichocladiopsis]|uniref:Thioredoxin-like protein n=1 Tax=Microdochium trichocladiopsis TaxID=1682393 RepID=A0A9P9BQY5_9PEZI|nr:uncharacterized protein B0I36DRAFT_382107 [Microdochium trichocladiopsis]KAH7035383.1 hypothetical protein B0I36DRAFT_382107 [Microdochium trichocladiopsis]
MATKAPDDLMEDPALYIFTSLTAGSAHIVTATSRLETILRANRVPFKALDIAVDPRARQLWGRRAGKDPSGRQRKLPALFQEGFLVGDLVEIEEWNEYGELKEHVKIYHDEFTIPTKEQAAAMVPRMTKKPVAQPVASQVPAGAAGATKTENQKPTDAPKTPAANDPMRGLAEQAAQKAKQLKSDSLQAKAQPKKDAAAAATTAAKADDKAAAAKPAEKTGAATKTAAKKDEAAKADPAVAAATKGVSNLTISADKKEPGATKPTESAAAGLQSPTSGAWKSGGGPTGSADKGLQSPTTGKWAAGTTSLAGAAAAAAAAAAGTKDKKAAESSDDDSDEDESDSDDSDDSDEDEDDSDEEASKKQKAEEVKKAEPSKATEVKKDEAKKPEVKKDTVQPAAKKDDEEDESDDDDSEEESDDDDEDEDEDDDSDDEEEEEEDDKTKQAAGAAKKTDATAKSATAAPAAKS